MRSLRYVGMVGCGGSRGSGRGRRKQFRRTRASRGYLWAELMRRTFEIDVLTRPRRGGRLRLVALIEQASVVQRILRRLGPPTEVPEPRPARAPPGDSRRSRISPGRRSNSTRRGGGVASREGGVRAAARCCPPTVISLWYSSLFDDNRLQTPALSALCEGEGLRTIVLRTSFYANPT